MATPKFNLIALEFMERINDPTTESGAPAVVQAGSILDSTAKIENFVNRALFKLFNDIWTAVNGDGKLFLQILPELGVEKAITTTAGGVYVIDTGALLRDFAKVVGARKATGNVFVEVVEPHLLEEFNTGRNTELEPTADEPYVLENQRSLYFFPASEYNAQSVYVHYIKMPMSSVDGSFITSGGSVDSPYYDHWNSKIADIAAQLFFETSGER